MAIKLPVRIGIMDDDFFALKWNADLLTRDLRTTVLIEAESPDELLIKFKRYPGLDIILLDVEYSTKEIALDELLSQLYCINDTTLIVCLSQYGGLYAFQIAVDHGVRGFLLKREIRMEIGSAVMQAMISDFLISPGVFSLVKENFPNLLRITSLIVPWMVNPTLTPQLNRVFNLRVLYGMSAPLTAQEIHLATGTIEKYMQHIYQKLSVCWGDERYLMGINLNTFPQEVQAFHQYNLPPLKMNLKKSKHNK